jgi:branched-chain amino acid transport system substrate-binding protein
MASRGLDKGFARRCLELLFTAALLGFWGCCSFSTVRAQNVTPPRFGVGIVMPLTGSLGPAGRDVLRGIEVSQEELRKRRPELASRIEIHVEDTQSLGHQSEIAARKLVSTRKADVLVGALTSSTTFQLAKTTTEIQRPLVVPTATAPDLTLQGDSIFRTALADDDQGAALARFAIQKMAKTRAAIVVEKNSTYSRALTTSFEKAWTSSGGTVVAKREVDSDSSDVGPAISAIRKANVDVIFAPVYYQQAEKLLEEAHRQGVRVSFLGSDSWDSPKLWTSVSKAALKDHYVAVQFSPIDPNPTVRSFVEAYRAKFGEDPGVYAAQGYDAYQFIAKGLSTAKSTLTSNVTKALHSATDVPGLAGPFSLNARREPEKDWVILKTSAKGLSFEERVRGQGPMAVR